MHHKLILSQDKVPKETRFNFYGITKYHWNVHEQVNDIRSKMIDKLQ